MRTELAIGVQRTVAWRRTTPIASCLFVPCVSFVARSSPQENCCQRDVYRAPFTMPAGDSEKWDDFYLFKVRASGGLAVQYQAPDDCKPGEETLTVWYTCSKRKHGSDRSGGNFQLAKKEFNIVCDQYEVKSTYAEILNDQEGTVGGMRRTVGHTYSATAKARVTFASADRLEAIYESKSTQLDLNDSFNQHWIAEKKDLRCDARISWTGTHNGDHPAKRIVKFNAHGRHYAVGSGKKGGQVTYRVALNLYNDDRCGAVIQTASAWSLAA